MTTATIQETKGEMRWDSLQGIGVVLMIACLLICIEFLLFWLMFDPNSPSIGFSGDNAKTILAIYGPVLVITFNALRDSLDKMIVAFKGRTVEWIVFSHRAGAVFHYSLAILGALAPMIALLVLALHKSTVTPEVLTGVAATIWSMTAGNFIRKYLEPYGLTAPVSAESHHPNQAG